MSAYWFWYKFQRTVMWLALLSMSSLALLGIVIGGFLFVIQKSHWIPCEQDVMSPEFRARIASYAAGIGGEVKRCDMYRIESESPAKRASRRANYRLGIVAEKHRLAWSYWTLLPDGSMRPESPGAFALLRQAC